MYTIDTVVVADLASPSEVQTWFVNNPSVTVISVTLQSNIFYIIHN